MTAELVPLESLTYEEYVKLEHLSEVRHEFVGGQVYAMSDATEAHDLVAGAIYAALRGPFRSTGCRTFIFNRNLRMSDDGYYPDIVVTCGTAGHRHNETDASWVIEVLSPSTEDHDRREETVAYGKLESLQVYLLVDPAMEYAHPAGGYGPRPVIDLDSVQLDLAELFAEARGTLISE
jgi:Uma2 family endonuclease